MIAQAHHGHDEDGEKKEEAQADSRGGMCVREGGIEAEREMDGVQWVLYFSSACSVRTRRKAMKLIGSLRQYK